MHDESMHRTTPISQLPTIHQTIPLRPPHETTQVNGEVCNTVRAIWTEDKSQLKEEDYKDFYRFVANAYDDPTYRCVCVCALYSLVI